MRESGRVSVPRSVGVEHAILRDVPCWRDTISEVDGFGEQAELRRLRRDAKDVESIRHSKWCFPRVRVQTQRFSLAYAGACVVCEAMLAEKRETGVRIAVVGCFISIEHQFAWRVARGILQIGLCPMTILESDDHGFHK